MLSTSWLKLALATGAFFLLAHKSTELFTAARAQDASSHSPALRAPATPLPEKLPTPEFFVMIDPAHGGDDHGTLLPGKVHEKELTLTLSRELKKQLEERGIHARLLREADTNLSLDRRAESTNQEHAGIYIAVHAGRPGKGVRIYSAAIPSLLPAAPERFIPWDNAQAGALTRSRALARAVSDELRNSAIPVAVLSAPLRPLNNVLVPAISVEWAPEPGDFKASQTFKSAAKLASAVASGVAQAQASLGVRP